MDEELLRLANQKVDKATLELNATSDNLLSLGGDIAQVSYAFSLHYRLSATLLIDTLYHLFIDCYINTGRYNSNYFNINLKTFRKEKDIVTFLYIYLYKYCYKKIIINDYYYYCINIYYYYYQI